MGITKEQLAIAVEQVKDYADRKYKEWYDHMYTHRELASDDSDLEPSTDPISNDDAVEESLWYEENNAMRRKPHISPYIIDIIPTSLDNTKRFTFSYDPENVFVTSNGTNLTQLKITLSVGSTVLNGRASSSHGFSCLPISIEELIHAEQPIQLVDFRDKIGEAWDLCDKIDARANSSVAIGTMKAFVSIDNNAGLIMIDCNPVLDPTLLEQIGITDIEESLGDHTSVEVRFSIMFIE